MTKVESKVLTFRRPLEITALVIGVVAIVVTTFFSLRAERNKDLTLRYLAVRPMINPEAGEPGRVLVTYKGRILAQPWLLSAHLENTGDLPIEDRDIESPLTLAFRSAVVVGAEISQRSPDQLNAVTTSDSAFVTIRHLLMNPGDWIDFDVLLDGQPDLPEASVRISGVRELKEIGPVQVQAGRAITYPDLPEPVQYLAMAATGMLIAISILSALFLLTDTIRSLLGYGKSAGVLQWLETLEASELKLQVSEFYEPISTILASLPFAITAELADRREVLANAIDAVPHATLARIALDRETFAGAVASAVRVQVRQEIAVRVFNELPIGPDRPAREAIKEVPYGDDVTFTAYRQGVLKAVAAAGVKPSGWASVDRTGLSIGIGLLVLGILALAVLAGAIPVSP